MAARIDLRSDTVTLPSPGMRQAMARARVGDARRGEDPSVRKLEERSAALFGKEAGLFLPSGTMGNLAAVSAWTRPGDLVVASASSHLAGRESPGIARLAAVTVVGIATEDGAFDAPDVAEAAARAHREGEARVRLVSAENTHNAGGGTVFPLGALRRIRAWCRKEEVPLHLDGSRIFNASVASGVSLREYGRTCDSLMFCLSKGLGAPVGSVVVGGAEFVREAREVSLRLGGGMRQSGIVAAGGLYALGHHVARLSRDHEHARALADGLSGIPGIVLVNAPVRTNIVLFRWETPALDRPSFQKEMEARGVLLDDRSFPLFRAVTHLGVGKAEVVRAVRAVREVTAGGRRLTA